MKNTIFHILDDLGLVWKYALNGVVGGLIWSTYKKFNVEQSTRQILIGGVVSGYFTPVIIAKTNMDMSTVGFTSFVVGMLGMVILDFFYKYAVNIVDKWKEAVVVANQKSELKT